MLPSTHRTAEFEGSDPARPGTQSAGSGAHGETSGPLS